jgi:hypothetical protein
VDQQVQCKMQVPLVASKRLRRIHGNLETNEANNFFPRLLMAQQPQCTVKIKCYGHITLLQPLSFTVAEDPSFRTNQVLHGYQCI